MCCQVLPKTLWKMEKLRGSPVWHWSPSWHWSRWTWRSALWLSALLLRSWSACRKFSQTQHLRLNHSKLTCCFQQPCVCCPKSSQLQLNVRVNYASAFPFFLFFYFLFYLFSSRSVLLPTSMMMTSLPLSVLTSSIHLQVCWNEFTSVETRASLQIGPLEQPVPISVFRQEVISGWRFAHLWCHRQPQPP